MTDSSTHQRHRRTILVGALGVVLLVFSAPAQGAPKTKTELQLIMQDLSSSMAAIQEALWRDDWEKIAKGADAVNNHIKPSVTTKAAILWRLGLSAPRFQSSEENMQAAATRLVTSATGGEPKQIVEDFSALQRTCVGCHSIALSHFK